MEVEVSEFKRLERPLGNSRTYLVLDEPADLCKLADHHTKESLQFLHIRSKGLVFTMEFMGGQKESKDSLSSCDSAVSWWPCLGITGCYGSRGFSQGQKLQFLSVLGQITAVGKLGFFFLILLHKEFVNSPTCRNLAGHTQVKCFG